MQAMRQDTTTFSLDGKRHFVSGLSWHPLSGSAAEEMPRAFGKKAGPETVTLAERMGCDAAVWRDGSPVTVGLAHTDSIQAKSVYSAAAAVAQAMDKEGIESFLAVFHVQGHGYVYVAQHAGVILPDGDYCGPEEEIRSRLMDQVSISSDWQVIIAPDAWGLTQSSERAIEEVLPEGKGGAIAYHPSWQVRPIKENSRQRLIIMAAFGCALFVGFKMYQDHKAEQERLEHARRMAALQAGAPVQDEAPPPWFSMPRADKVVSACLDKIKAFPTFHPAGWKPVNGTCNQNSFTMSWSRHQRGTIDWMMDAYPDATFSHDGETATVTVSYQLNGAMSQEPAPQSSGRVVQMNAAAHRQGFDLNVSRPQAPPSGAPRANQPPPPSWREMTWSITGTHVSPDEIVKALDGDGFRLDSVTMNMDGNRLTWDLRGKQYAN